MQTTRDDSNDNAKNNLQRAASGKKNDLDKEQAQELNLMQPQAHVRAMPGLDCDDK